MSEPTRITDDIRPPNHDDRMMAARNRARWELGDSSWADVIVGAYLWPDADSKALVQDMRGSDAR